MIEIPYLKEFFNSIKKTTIDDYVDRLNYCYTAMLLTFFALLTGAKQTIGKPIECMMPAEYPITWSNYVREFCFVSSTYFVPINETTNISTRQNNVSQGYYQWVPFILVIQALLIYLPNLAWKTFQNSQSIDFQFVVQKAKDLRFVIGDEQKKGIKDVVSYLKQRLRYQGKRDGCSYVGFGIKSSLLHILTKMLTLLVIFIELHFMNKTFGNGNDSYWGITMLKNGLTNAHWDETGVFPRITFCDFKQPIFGGPYPQRTVQCVLMINMINEKIFIFVWLWLAASFIISIFDLFYKLVTRFASPLRRKSTRDFVQTLNHSSCNSTNTTSSSGYMNEDDKLIDFAADIMGADGIHLFKFIKFNAGSQIACEIGSALFDNLYNEDSHRPPSRFGNNIHTLGEDQGKSHC